MNENQKQLINLENYILSSRNELHIYLNQNQIIIKAQLVIILVVFIKKGFYANLIKFTLTQNLVLMAITAN